MGQYDWSALINPAVIWILIPLGGLAAGLILQMFRMHHRHVERMAMIESGIDPDAVDRDAREAAAWSPAELEPVDGSAHPAVRRS